MTPNSNAFDCDVAKLARVRRGIDPSLVQSIVDEGKKTLQEMEEKIARYESERSSINDAMIAAQKAADGIVASANNKSDQKLEETKAKCQSLLDENYAAIQGLEADLEQMSLLKQKFAEDFRSLLVGYTSELDARFPAIATVRRSQPAPQPSPISSETEA
jgi:hypothetical protein